MDILKIDKSFVDRIGEGSDELPADVPQPSVMVSAISQLGHALNLELVAEGIEQREQVSTLLGLACQYGQGYYFARPLTSGALAELLHRQAAEPGWTLDPASPTRRRWRPSPADGRFRLKEARLAADS